MTVASVALRSGAKDAYVVDENGGSIADLNAIQKHCANASGISVPLRIGEPEPSDSATKT